MGWEGDLQAMSKMRRVAALVAGAAVAAVALTGCTDADVATHNLSRDADNFKVDRRVVFFNGITDEYLLTIEGRCAITDQEIQLEVICKVDDDRYKKHFLGLSDNVSYFVEQLEPREASASNYKVVFKPSTILPDIEIR